MSAASSLRCRVASLLDQGWVVPSSTSHTAFEAGLDGRGGGRTWRFRQDYRGRALVERSVGVREACKRVRSLGRPGCHFQSINER
jgi:hypothetical protein